MSHANEDGAKLRELAHELLDDPLGKANNIIPLLKAVHASKPAVGFKESNSLSAGSCWDYVDKEQTSKRLDTSETLCRRQA